jgi:hypothetical protein
MRGGSSASLDRFDPQQEYIMGNLRWVHKEVNRMKWELPQDRFIEICPKVTKHHEQT